MANLQDLFKDYLVSYTPNPVSIPQEIVDFPESSYDRLISYNTNKPKEDTKEEKPEETSQNIPVFTQWSYYFEEPETTSRRTSEKPSDYKDKDTWVSEMTAAYKKLGLNDNAIKNLIAKNALESGWGKSTVGNFNFGNITSGKYWKGRTTNGKDKDKNGKIITNTFRDYDSLDEFVKDEIDFLTRLYDFDQNDSLARFLNKLQGGNSAGRQYAEDPHYKSKVSNVYLSI